MTSDEAKQALKEGKKKIEGNFIREIDDFPGYLITDQGDIISLPKSRKGMDKYGVENLRQYKGKIICVKPNNNGYVHYTFYNNSKRKLIYIHRLVATSFIPNPLNLPQVNHKNGLRHDNRVENLEWCNNSHNQIHRFNRIKEKQNEN